MVSCMGGMVFRPHIYCFLHTAIALQSIHLFQSHCIFFFVAAHTEIIVYVLRILSTHIISLRHHSHKHLPFRHQAAISSPSLYLLPLAPLLLLPSPAGLTRPARPTRPKPRPKGKTASRSKPNATTNRVYKPTSSNRTARGYIYIDETSRTVSPDFIAETPPPS